MKHKLLKKFSKKALLALAGLIFFFSFWFFLSLSNTIKPFFLPSPLDVSKALLHLLFNADLLGNIFISTSRVFFALLISLFIAVPFGFLIGSSKNLATFFEPLISFVRYVPPSAFVPLSILWLGIGEPQKLFVLFIGTAPYLLLLTADIVSNVRTEYLEAGSLLGASTWQLHTRILFPASLPGIWDALRLMVGATWSLIVLVEMIAAQKGLGHIIIQSQRYLQTAQVFVIIFILGFIGLVTDVLLKYCYNKIFLWTERSGKC